MNYFVYILASRYKGTLYVGMTRNLSRRVEQGPPACLFRRIRDRAGSTCSRADAEALAP
jgi:hypothetical protein